jgi:hypothetical protein
MGKRMKIHCIFYKKGLHSFFLASEVKNTIEEKCHGINYQIYTHPPPFLLHVHMYYHLGPAPRNTRHLVASVARGKLLPRHLLIADVKNHGVVQPVKKTKQNKKYQKGQMRRRRKSVPDFHAPFSHTLI